MGIRALVNNPKNIWDTTPYENWEELRPNPTADVLLIVGDAKCVFDDLDRFYDLGVAHDTMCINHIASVFPGKFHHFVAGDSHMAPMQTVAGRLPKQVVKHCWNPGSTNFTVRWVKDDYRSWNGTTATLAVKVGLKLDYTRLVLAGCPMDYSGHWYDKWLPPTDMKTRSDHRAHLWFWTDMAKRPIARFIRSMSGNTKELFGEPTTSWLKGGNI